MNDQELRALVREAVERHMGSRFVPEHPQRLRHLQNPQNPHPSHALYVRLVNVSEACVIEPSVTCEHCGYCKSHGH